MSAIILETERLVLREMTEDDAKHLLALRTTPNVMRYIPGEPALSTIDDAIAVLRNNVFLQYARGVGRWACIEKASGAFVGWSGVKYMEEDDEHDVGYRFYEEHWGKGFATESARAVCDFSRARLAGKRVVGKVMPGNLASKRVLEKCGMEYEKDDGTFLVYVLRT
jgi:RimJ/RimL family protein N-acetyltransferase